MLLGVFCVGQKFQDESCYGHLSDGIMGRNTVMRYPVITTGRRLWNKDSQARIFESYILSEKNALDAARAGLLSDIQKGGKVHGR